MYLQPKKIVESASAFGNGFNMEPKLIPNLHTDFIFTYIVYTFGWVAAAVLITLIVAFILKIINVAKTTKNPYGKLIVSGFIAILTTEFLLNIGMNFGIAPIMGISLPFMSFGGSQLLINMTIVGLILSVYRRKDITHNMAKKEAV
ncbi:putative peptidoglycan glycosyltransferase FtsW [bioreactor metagenome]|uniref:Putative peptidoglycan glycosyltransferase FtsW n=1 Tax=bioreactor metagenome TaxID=1076179 RepID=A0A644Y3B0_9ZZZZ